MRNIMTFKNYQLLTLVEALNYKMPLKTGRFRNEFLALIEPRIKLNEKNRLEILKKFAVKNDDGNPKIEKGQYILDTDKSQEIQKEYELLMSENYDLDILPSMKPKIFKINEILENSTVDMDSRGTGILMEVLTVFDETCEEEKPPKKKKK